HPGADLLILRRVGRPGRGEDEACIHRVRAVRGAQEDLALPLARRVRAPERSLAPQRAQLCRERELVPGARVDEAAVLLRRAACERVFVGAVTAQPLAQSAERHFVRAPERLLAREAHADHPEPEMLAGVEGVGLARRAARAGIRPPELADGP